MDELVGLNHLRTIVGNLKKSKDLLNNGKDVLPYSKWQDKILEIVDEVEEHIKNENK